MADYLDPFCAPEFLIDDIAFRTMVGTDYVRLGFCTEEQSERILRVKLVFPVHRLIEAQSATRMFVMTQQEMKRRQLVLN